MNAIETMIQRHLMRWMRNEDERELLRLDGHTLNLEMDGAHVTLYDGWHAADAWGAVQVYDRGDDETKNATGYYNADTRELKLLVHATNGETERVYNVQTQTDGLLGIWLSI